MRYLLLAIMLLTACSQQSTRPTREPKTAAEIEAVEGVYNATVEDETEKVVCRKETVINSRVPRTVCRTVAQMAFAERDAKRIIKKPKPVSTNQCSIANCD